MQLSLKGKPVADVGVWKIDNPYLNVSYERRTQGMLALDSWVDNCDLTEENPLIEVSSPLTQGMPLLLKLIHVPCGAQ